MAATNPDSGSGPGHASWEVIIWLGWMGWLRSVAYQDGRRGSLFFSSSHGCDDVSPALGRWPSPHPSPLLPPLATVVTRGYSSRWAVPA